MSVYPKVGDVLTADSPEPPVGTFLIDANGYHSYTRTRSGWVWVFPSSGNVFEGCSWLEVGSGPVTVIHVPEQPDPYEVGRWYLTQVYADPLLARQYGEDRLFRTSPALVGVSADDLHWISPVPVPAECLPEVDQ